MVVSSSRPRMMSLCRHLRNVIGKTASLALVEVHTGIRLMNPKETLENLRMAGSVARTGMRR